MRFIFARPFQTDGKTMTAEWISIGLLALLVLFFVLDIAGNRKRAPRPKAVVQSKPEVARGPAPAGPEPAREEPAPA